MNRVPFALLLLAIVAINSFTVSGQSSIEKQRTFLSILKAGQPISLKEIAGRYEISTLEGIPVVQGHKVMEIGADHVVVQDITGIHEIHIPVYSIKAITRVKQPK